MPRWQGEAGTDDVARFTADAVAATGTGPVNIAGEGSLSMREIAGVMGQSIFTVSENALRAGISAAWKLQLAELAPAELCALLYMPIVDTTRLREDTDSRRSARRRCHCPGEWRCVQIRGAADSARLRCVAPTRAKSTARLPIWRTHCHAIPGPTRTAGPRTRRWCPISSNTSSCSLTSASARAIRRPSGSAQPGRRSGHGQPSSGPSRPAGAFRRRPMALPWHPRSGVCGRKPPRCVANFLSPTE